MFMYDTKCDTCKKGDCTDCEYLTNDFLSKEEIDKLLKIVN